MSNYVDDDDQHKILFGEKKILLFILHVTKITNYDDHAQNDNGHQNESKFYLSEKMSGNDDNDDQRIIVINIKHFYLM